MSYKTPNEDGLREQFKNHVLEQDRDMIIWRKPGDSHFLVRYHLYQNVLSVSGDLGCAVYQWHGGKIDFSFLAGCGLSYFEEKCQASENGRDHKEWDSRHAHKRIEELFSEEYEGYGHNQEHKEQALSASESQFEWDHFMYDHGYEAFGDEYYEYGNIGMVISTRCEAHLTGLKMIQEHIERITVGGRV